MPEETLRRRIFVLLALSIVIALGAAAAVRLLGRRGELEVARAEDRAAVERLLRADAEVRTESMGVAAAVLTADPALAAAFRDRDRERVLDRITPAFDAMRGRLPGAALSLLTSDGEVFVRLPAPAEAPAREPRSPPEGAPTLAPTVEMRPSDGLPTLRRIVPWTSGGERLGYVELERPFRGFAARLRDELGVHAFVVVDKGLLEREAWEAEARTAGGGPDWDRYDRVVLVDGTRRMPPRGVDAHFADLVDPGRDQLLRTALDRGTWTGETIPLREAGGRVVGQVAFVGDRTALLATSTGNLVALVVLLLLIGLALAAALHRTLSRQFVRPLENLRALTEGTGGIDSAAILLASRGGEMGDLGEAVNRLIRELRVSQEDRTRKIVDAAHDAVVIADERGLIVDWNARAEAIFGWSREEAVGMTLTETLIPEEHHAEHLAGIRRFREGNGGTMVNRRVEVTARRRGGDRFPAELTVTPIYSEDGFTLAAFIRDITERRTAERALRASEERFRRLVETANVVPWEADSRTTRVTYVGPQAERLVGFPLAAWYEEGFWIQRVHPEDREHALTQLAVAAAREEPAEFEYRMQHRDGHVVWVRDIVVADVSEDGPVLRGFRFDVTEQRRLEEELFQSQKMEAVGRLAGGIAHDFNNILTAIMGYAALLDTSFAEEAPERADVAEIQRAAGHAADLTQQLLAFARRQVIRPRVMVIDEMVGHFEKMIGRLIGEDVDLSVRTAAQGFSVRVDPGRFEQALMNLVLNARDAMPRGGSLTLATERAEVDPARASREGVEPGTFVVVSVTDTGIGMDEATLARAFEPFFTTKPDGAGTGLGLSSAYGVIHQADGFLEVHSVPDEGSSFRIFLPLVSDPADSQGGSAPPGPPLEGDETILLVEDEPQVRDLAERALRRRGYRVLIAQNGAEAVERSRGYEGTIHLLLTDVVMPVMGGLRAADAIREGRPGVQVLFMSGYSEESLFGEAVEEEVNFLHKPFTPSELEAKVREVLDTALV